MLEAFHALDLDLKTLFNNVFDTVQFEEMAWFSGLFCADLQDMETIGAAYQAYGPEAFNGVQTIGSCATLQDQYHVDIKYFGKIYTFNGQSIQIIGSVPHGTNGPMVYSFVRVNPLYT